MPRSTLRRFNHSGFTLLETLVAISIFVGIAAILVAIVTNTIRTQLRERAQAETTARVREAMDLLGADLKQAFQTVSSLPTTYNPAGPCQLSGAGPSFTHPTSGTSIVVIIPAIDGSNNPIPGVNDQIIYYRNVSGGYARLCRKVIPASGSSRAQTVTMLLNNTTFLPAFPATAIFKYYDSNNALLSSAFFTANSVEAGFTQTYVNERTGQAGFGGGPAPAVDITQRFYFKNF